MNILFLTKSKTYTCKFLEYLISKHNVIGVVCKKYDVIVGTELESICNEHSISIYENDTIYKMIEDNTMPHVDLAISNTYGRLIRKPLLDWVSGNCINFHGAILPNYKGLFAYNHGLLNGETEWGVTAHYVNECFDEGEIIAVKKFVINPDEISVSELENLSQKQAYELGKVVVDMWEREGKLSSYPQESKGHYYSKEDFERAKKVFIDDSSELVKRKIHAFWCPPYEGAYIEIDGTRFQLLPVKEQIV